MSSKSSPSTTSSMSSPSSKSSPNPAPALLPQPQSLAYRDGHFTLPSAGVIGIGDAILYPIAADLQALFLGLAIHASYSGGADAISVALREGLHRDGYRLGISPTGIRIEAGAVSGAFYAFQTLRQLVEQAVEGALPCLEIPAGANEFRLEGVATAQTANRIEHRRASLFYATDNACSDSAGFGIIKKAP